MKLKINYIDIETGKGYNCIVRNEKILTKEDKERVKGKIERVIKKKIKLINWKRIDVE